MSKFMSVSATLASTVGAGASFTIAYPAEMSRDDFVGGTDHFIFTQSYRPLSAKAGDFSVLFGASNITVTNNAGIALPVGTLVTLHLDKAEMDSAALSDPPADPASMSVVQMVKINLGKPATSDADGIVVSQACTAASGLAAGINGALATDGVATFDVPRAVVAAWTGAAVLTVYGTDAYGQPMRESSGSGTSMTGKKAFKTVTNVTSSADITGLTVGTGKVLGLPVFLGDVADVVREQQNGAVAAAGTVVAGDQTTPSATTGDVRGTYAPAGTPNGALQFELIVAVRSKSYKGHTQFNG